MQYFVKELEIPSRRYPSEWIDQIKTGDFNGDGNVDFVVTRINFDFGSTPSTLQLYLGNGRGGFVDGTESIFSKGIPQVNFVPRMLVADFNSDGVSDLFCIDNGIDKPPFSGGQNKLFLSQNGLLVDATASLPQGLKNNHGASAGDVNHDGRLDILVNALMYDGNDLQVNTGDKFVSSPGLLPDLKVINPWSGIGSLPQTHTWSALIDVNNDANLDMILGHWDNLQSTKQSVIYFNTKNGSFVGSPHSLPLSGIESECVLDIKPIDLNGDALVDLALSITNGGDRSAFYRTPYVQLLVNDGDGKFHDETPTRFSQSTEPASNEMSWYKSIDVIDINHDGYLDMILDGPYEEPSKVLLNDGFGNFKETFAAQRGQKVAVADVDHDGMSDLILSSSTMPDGFEVMFNNFENGHVYKANFGGDSLLGSEKSDVFISGNGNDMFAGNGGRDLVQFGAAMSTFSINKIGDSFEMSDRSLMYGTDTLLGISRINFTDINLALDTGKSENGGQAYRLYKAAFDLTPDNEGLGYWINAFDHGADLTGVASSFIASPEFAAMYGVNCTDTNFVTLLYNHVLHRNPDAEGNAYWLNALQHGMSKGAVLASFSESPENISQTAQLIANGIQYQEWLA